MDDKENPFLTTLSIPVKNSPILFFTVFCLHFICLFIPWITGLSININILLISVVIISFYIYQNQYNPRRGDNSVDSLILDAEDNWQVKLKNNTLYHAKLGKTLFVHPLLTIISLTINHKQKYFIFTPEIIDVDLFRRLRVRLRIKAGE